MTYEQAFLYDGHGHSRYSDGWNDPEQIIQWAILNGLNGVALTDHDTAKGLRRFLNAAAKANNQGQKILAVAGVEVSTREGHVTITVPDEVKAEKLMSEFKKPSQKPFALDMIEEAVDRYDALCTIVHPNFSKIKGMSFAAIDELIKQLSSPAVNNLILEVFNWQSQILYFDYIKNYQKAMERNKDWGMVEVAQTDYHRARHVGKNHTLLEMTEFTSAALTAAFKTGKAHPFTWGRQNLKELLFENAPISAATLVSSLLGLNGK